MRHSPAFARSPCACLLAAAVAVAVAPAVAAAPAFEGTPVPIGKGTAHTVVRAGENGKPASIGIVLTSGALDGLPEVAPKGHTDVAYVLPMPATGPRTVVDHVVVNWEPKGHEPPGIYDVPHFDFHFYFVKPAARMKVKFKDPGDSGQPAQQPPGKLMPAGYIMPPGTAVPEMGAHAVDPSSPEFNKQPFTATFIYGFYGKSQTFVEPMATLAFLKSKPDFSAPVKRPAEYSRPGAYPSSYSVRFDAARDAYEVTLEGLK